MDSRSCCSSLNLLALVSNDYFVAEGTYGAVFVTPKGDEIYKLVNDGRAFQTELRALRMIAEEDGQPHQNLCSLYAWGETNTEDIMYLRMESIPISLVESKELMYDATIEMKLKLCQNIASGIALALKHIHSLGIIHADVKIDNIMLREDYTPVLIDFSNSGFMDSDGKLIQHKDNFVGGAFCCASPEMLVYMIRYFGSHGYGNKKDWETMYAQKDVTANTDVYSLGCLMFGILCGERSNNFKSSDVEMLPKCHECTLVQVWKLNTIYSSLSPCVKSFVSGMMEIDSQKRMTTEDVLSHRFLCHTESNIVDSSNKGGEEIVAIHDVEMTLVA